MPRPEPIQDGGRIVRDRYQPRHPDYRWDGKPRTHKPWKGHPDHRTIIDNVTVINEINRYSETERMPNNYFWHEYGDGYWCHYYDDWGYHWVGFYWGDSYYWTRYYDGRWWYFDGVSDRWCYWHDGYWWYQDPSRVEVVYVYVGDGYYRYGGQTGRVILDPERPGRKLFVDTDGNRMVELFGDNGRAVLFDLNERDPNGDPKFLAFLGAGAVDVRFSEPGACDTGCCLKMVVVYQDGTLKLFDAYGELIKTRTAPYADALSNTEVGWGDASASSGFEKSRAKKMIQVLDNAQGDWDKLFEAAQ